ncbi:MAG TPA: DUF6505 family protein, partial [Dongiaceae bacterium]|nr:DUF6505 family protein [Dongiaceae bacterium]
MRFPRTIRLDNTDERVFERAAAPGEWAVPGGFAFADIDPAALSGKPRQAFASGFLGTASFGWSTFVAVTEIDEPAYAAVVEALAAHFVERYGAPSVAAARPAAQAEAAFAAGLCEHRINTLIRVERSAGAEGIAERFIKVEPPRGRDHARIWEIAEDSDA